MKQTRHQRKAFGRLLRKLGNTINIIRAVDSYPSFKSWLGNILLKDLPPSPQLQILPLKHIRLQELADAGINCPYFQYWLRRELNLVGLEDFWKKHGRISLRNFTEERILERTPELPVAWDKSNWDFISHFCINNNQIHHTMVNKAIPLEDSVLAGNIILLDSNSYIVSYFEGYGTPRHVDYKKPSGFKVYRRQFGSKPPALAPEQIENLIPQLHKFRSDFRPITFEFSIYPYPVGVYNRPEIFWEWRSGSTHDLNTIITKLLERTDSHEMIFDLSSSGIPVSELRGRSYSV